MAKGSVHPFVEGFFTLETGALEQRFAADPDPIVGAIMKTFAALGDHAQAPAALANANQLDLEGADQDLVVLMLHFLAMLSHSSGRQAEAVAYHHRAEALVSARTPRHVAALVLSIEAHAAQSGRWAEREKLLKRILQMVPPNVPRRQMWVMWYCEQLYFQGRGSEVYSYEAGLSDFYPKYRIAISKVNDNMERCAVEELEANLDLWAKGSLKTKMSEQARERCQSFADILRNRWRHGPLVPPGTNAAEEVSPSLLSLYALQQRRPQLALQWAQVYARQHIEHLQTLEFPGYTLLRAELACRNAAAARHLLEVRRTYCVTHYLDNFFQARISLLENDDAAAAAYFAKVWGAAKKLEAEPRLNFELSLAVELAPLDVARLMPQGKAAIALGRKPSSPKLAAVVEPANALAGLVGNSPALVAIRKRIRQFAPLTVPVLITGETGTGKEMVARALHDSSPRAKQPFIAVNCGAIAETLLESELFGHARGAFTGAERERAGFFQEAGAGTLFLDEIGEISPRLQVSLLRVLESGEVRPVGSSRARKVNCRVLFATNADLEKGARGGTFRSDLLFRLKRLELLLPPLRERPEDIGPLIDHYLNLGRERGAGASLTPDLRQLFTVYAWPGNVRELRNDVERLRLLNSDKRSYGVEDLEAAHRQKFEQSAGRAVLRQFSPPAGDMDAETIPLANDEASAAQVFRESNLRLRRLQRLKELFKRHETLTRREVARIFRISPITAARDLEILTVERFVERVEPSKSSATHYFKLAGA